jgi:shikimate kinase
VTTAGGHVVLVGSMGAGKTTVGRLVAAHLGRPFVDSDVVLRARTGRTAAQIAASDGTDVLHRLEADSLMGAVHASEPGVIAAAASVADVPALRARLPARTRVVWLRARPATLKRRALAGAHRPFVHDDPDAVARLDAARRDAYAAVANIVVDADDREPDEIAAEVERGLAGATA